jgi:hypothetical protein
MSKEGGGRGEALPGEIVVNTKRIIKKPKKLIDEIYAEMRATTPKFDRSSSPRGNKSFGSPPSFDDATPSSASMLEDSQNQKIKLVPECNNDKCDIQSHSKCRSTNYLEPFVAISCCYKTFDFDTCAEIFKRINDAATAEPIKTVKFDYIHPLYGIISFSNATRAMSHYKNFESSHINKTDSNKFLKEFEKSLVIKYEKIPKIKTCYIGYIPKDLLLNDAHNEKHQVFSDVFFLLDNKEFFGVSCKAEMKCPLSNWWVDSYLWHCKLNTEYNGFLQKIKERKQQHDEERYKIDEKYKATMRSQWNDEDRQVNSSKSSRITAKALSKASSNSTAKARSNSSSKSSAKSRSSGSGSDSSRTSVSTREPIFRHGSIMDYIQTIFKEKQTEIAGHLVSDVFAQTMHYDVFLAVAGKTPKCLVLTDYMPLIRNVEMDFSIGKATSGKHSKFIFGMNVSFPRMNEIFKFHVEIRRSGSYNDYRIHIILDKIVSKDLLNNKTKRSLSL